MRAAAMPFELDVHHTILPPLGRLRPDAADLFAAAVPSGEEGWWALNDADQVLHAAAHLFQDSDCVGNVRDLVDIESLVREAVAKDRRFPSLLAERAKILGLERPLWYALDLVRDWLELPPEVAPEALLAPPHGPAVACVRALARRCMVVIDPDSEASIGDRVAYGLMALRAQWLRMPPWLLAYHTANKLVRAKSDAVAAAK
jgi:hypothetical protein